MEFIISCIIYIVVCEVICSMFNLDTFNEKSWIYAIVGVFGGFILKSIMA